MDELLVNVRMLLQRAREAIDLAQRGTKPAGLAAIPFHSPIASEVISAENQWPAAKIYWSGLDPADKVTT
jgi:hypothetical protein